MIPNRANEILYGTSEQIKKICRPLTTHLGIDFFVYSRFFDDGTSLILSTDPGFIEELLLLELEPKLSELISVYKSRRHYICFSDRIPLPHSLQRHEQEKFYKQIQLGNSFNIFHRLYHLSRQLNHYVIVGFGITKDCKYIMENYINSKDYLERFVKYFEEEAKHLIDKANRNRFIIPRYIDVDINVARSLSGCYLTRGVRTIALGDKFVTLTNKEFLCLKYKINGLSAKEIALMFDISYRTVETHINNARKKVGPVSKQKLMLMLNFPEGLTDNSDVVISL